MSASAPAPKVRPVTLEEKRARQRAYVKKSYYRQQNTVHALKQQMQQLEVEYKRLESAVARTGPDNQTIPKSHVGEGELEENETDDDDCDATALTSAYAQLTLLKEKLRKENRVLASVVREHEKFQHQLGKLADSEKSSSASRSATDPNATKSITRRPPAVIKPFTVEECQQIAAKCYAQLFQFQQTNAFESTGANVFGWRDERRVLDGDRFNFSIKKFFYGRTASDLSLAGWRLNSTPRFRDLYPNTIAMDVHALQQVDADNVILYREIHSPDGLLVEKTLFLTSRFRIDNGYVILFQSLDHKGRIADVAECEPESESPSEVDVKIQKAQERWRGLLTWVVFEEAGENAEHCMFKFGGMVPSNSAVWMLEILLIVLRWENLVVGPVFSIC